MTVLEIIGDILECHKTKVGISLLRSEEAN